MFACFRKVPISVSEPSLQVLFLNLLFNSLQFHVTWQSQLYSEDQMSSLSTGPDNNATLENSVTLSRMEEQMKTLQGRPLLNDGDKANTLNQCR